MPKAMLELEMPESCGKCPCGEYIGFNNYKCGALKKYCPREGRRTDCPLKAVDIADKVNIDELEKIGNIWDNPKLMRKAG